MSGNIKVIISMVIWGSIGIFVKNLNLPSVQIAFLRAAISSIFLLLGKLIYDKLKGNKHHTTAKKSIVISIISGMVMSFNWLFLFQSYKYTSISVATLSYYMAPVFVILLSPFVLKEKITISSILSVIMAMAGLVLIINPETLKSTMGNSEIKGVIFALMAAALYASVVLMNKFNTKIDGLDKTVIQMISAAIILLPFISLKDIAGIHGSYNWIIIIIIALVHTALAYFLYFSSIPQISAQRVSILSYIDPISAVIFGMIFFSERLSFIQCIGGILILVSAFLVELISKVSKDKLKSQI
ncbi:EamA family transporter [Clostridium sp. JN-9]|uniref:DMT family transporter n=1 Tax=Clostridium sp. JN-9 TaxID=2507159 RepID=UPI000FFE1806|nr:EamA family transporter [Clostridium sp. JN-9]QAT40584.1 EamA/RhaT family transporter [Clostridium sp. JN-9]